MSDPLDRPITLRELLALVKRAIAAGERPCSAPHVGAWTLSLLAAELRREPEAGREPGRRWAEPVAAPPTPICGVGPKRRKFGEQPCPNPLPCPLHPQAPADAITYPCDTCEKPTPIGEQCQECVASGKQWASAASSDPPGVVLQLRAMPKYLRNAVSTLRDAPGGLSVAADCLEWLATAPAAAVARLALSGDAYHKVRRWLDDDPGYTTDEQLAEAMGGAIVLNADELLPLLRAVRRLAGCSSTGDADDAVAEILDAWIALTLAKPATAAYAWHTFTNQPHG